MSKTIQKIAVKSSTVEAIGYDWNSKTLRVWFLNGGVYDYANFPGLEFKNLQSAASVGSYLSRNIKGKYTHTKVL